jgi:hypothetical protein
MDLIGSIAKLLALFELVDDVGISRSSYKLGKPI